ncbi:LysR family transcriptional regulator [Paraburkholderia sp. MM5482-R1]|uniref:LysR family transcriptional regulator n=1 Tax=unclassified Paraburkholderia TaxID=2615204 RepID=UPI003D230B52
MIDVKPLRYFVTLAEARHFGRSAKLLNLTQPPLSRQLAALEASIGVKLVERSSHQVTLTQAGLAFYRDAKAILASLNVAEQNVRAIAADNRDKLAWAYHCGPARREPRH